MLVKFHSSAAGNLILFAEPAARLLRALGKECSARGVITAEQLPAAIATLDALIHRSEAAPSAAAAEDEEAVLPVDLARRAVPLLKLLRHTQAEDGYVLWEAPQDFGSCPQ